MLDDRDQVAELDATPYDEDNVVIFQDVYHVGSGPVQVFGSLANDTLAVTSVGSTLNVTKNGTVFKYPRAQVSRVNIRGLSGNDIMSAINIDKNVALIGGLGNDVLTGGSSSDLLNGGGGDDIINGGAGNDTLIGNAAANTLDGGLGTDTLDGKGDIDIGLNGEVLINFP